MFLVGILCLGQPLMYLDSTRKCNFDKNMKEQAAVFQSSTFTTF